MISIRYELKGGFGPYARQIRAHTSQIVATTAEDMAAWIKQSFEDDKSGAFYLRDDGSAYQASAPGEPPAIREGELYESIQWAMLDDLTAAVWTDDEKAAWLNYGTDRVEPRPFWEPAIDQARELFVEDMQRLEGRFGG